MSNIALDRATSLLPNPKIRAFLHVIGAGESNELLDDTAYRICNVGSPLTSWAHPWYGITTNAAGHSTAAGAFQHLGTSWKEASDALGLGNEFTPLNQQLAAIWAIDVKRRALTALLSGDLALTIEKLRDEWISLPGLGHRAYDVFKRFGGEATDSPTPAPQPKPTAEPKLTGAVMNPLMFLPVILELIPTLTGLFAKGERGQKNAQAAQVVVDAFTKAVPGAINEQDAIQKASADASIAAAAKAAIMSDPNVLALIEVSGGAKEARAADLAWATAPAPFYRASPVFWISIILLPMVLWYVGSSIAGGVSIPEAWPWYAQLPLKLLGGAWDAGARVGLANLVVGLVLGGICGVYFGVSVTQNNQRRGTDVPAP